MKLTKIRSKVKKGFQKIKQAPGDLRRRNSIIPLIEELQLPSGRNYPVFCIGGNCQAQPIREWLSSSFPYCKIHALPPYHLIKDQIEIDSWISKAKSADFVMMITVRDSYGGFKFGSNYVKSLLSGDVKFISYPTFHLDVFYPFFSNVKTNNGEVLKGTEMSLLGHKYGDYHDFLAMALSSKNQFFVTQFCNRVREIDQSHSFASELIEESAVKSFMEFAKRHPDYIELIKSDIKNGMVHAYNHPTGSVLSKIYKLIWTNNFGLPENSFKEYKGDPLSSVTLPIPSFVSKAILRRDGDTPWAGTVEKDNIHTHQPIDDYIENLSSCIDFYRANPSIVNLCISHNKLELAERFLAELAI